MRFARHLHLSAALLPALGAAACQRADLPDPSSATYAEVVAAFYRGVAAAQAGESGVAAAAFQRVTELAPREPAGWANLGLIGLQRRELVEAADRLEQARRLAPENSRIELVAALVERDRGRLDSATEHLRRAVELDPPPRSLQALYLLVQLLEQEDRPGSAVEAQQLIDRILVVQPGNLVALLERARVAAKLRDMETLGQTLDRIGVRAESLSVPLRAELQVARTAGAGGEFNRAATQIAFLQAELQPLAAYRDDQDAVLTSPGRGELLLTRFVRLPTPTPRSAPPDTGLAFVPEQLSVAGGPVAWVRAVWLSQDAPLALIAATHQTLWISPEQDRVNWLAFPGGVTAAPLSPAMVAPFDYNYDFRMDLVLAGPGGLRLLRQEGSGSFTDVTAKAIPPTLGRAAYAGVWAADLDLEGDLDIVLAPAVGGPVVLRNRGDETFEAYRPFAGVSRARDFLWADLDADGDPDAAFLDAGGHLQLFLNGRGTPQFRPTALPDTLGGVVAMAAADLNHDAMVDLILLRVDGTLVRYSLVEGRWGAEPIARWPGFTTGSVPSTRLLVADLDNNGDLDLVASGGEGSWIWLSGAPGGRPLPAVDVPVTSIADLNADGRLDLIGVSPDGQSRLLVNRGSMKYYSATFQPAAQATGDRRINSFGIGGEVEIRAGLLYQKQLIEEPVVRVGLGEHPRVDVARIIWPNGSVQAEFNLSATNETILTRQRLKGSCPWVFTFDGARMQFVTDFLWRTALGLRINAQGEAAVVHSEDWIKIRGDQLAARDGVYDVRITAELWETHFFDQVALMVVDHPKGTEVFVDERFTLPAPAPAVHAMEPLRPVAWARDQTGRDVTALIRARDGRYLGTFELGSYQGIAREHLVEVALGDDVPNQGPLWLVASGWVYPTDASINVAVSQGDQPGPHGLRLEVPDGQGGWATVEPDLGFPAGKTKTMLIDLQHAFRPGTPRQVRLRTNMEIYWDQIAWTVGQPDAPITTSRLLPETAELRYRGFSEVVPNRRAAPELPDYGRIATAVPQWRDLVGFHTRFGDVRSLNEAVDDRYTIMNAGDELVLRFSAPPPPRGGWTRDFVLVGDGWVKDGDYNTGFSTTVLPLPYHGMADYAHPPGRLEDDPAFRRHPEDWKVFHTRYVTPRDFQRALVPAPDR